MRTNPIGIAILPISTCTTRRKPAAWLLAGLLLLLAPLAVADELMPRIPLQDPWQPILDDLAERYPERDRSRVVIVTIGEQKLHYLIDGKLMRSYPVSTSRYGIGSEAGSNRTPLGVHRVRRKIGADAPMGTIFKARQDTGRIAAIVDEPRPTDDDYVTTRILWLDGMEEGVNRGEGIDSFSRYIYLHGTHEEGLIGQPASHGCVRMYNRDVIELFDALPEDALVVIVE